MTEFLYLIECNADFYKIGIASDVESRMAQLQTGNPYLLSLSARYGFQNAGVVEKSLHQRFVNNRTIGEWFKLSDNDLDTFHQICKLLGGSSANADEIYTVSHSDIEDAEEMQDAIDHPNAWDFAEMFADGWQIETNGNGRENGKKKYWGWRKRKDGEYGYIYGGAVSDLPYPDLETMRKVYRDGEPV